MTGRRIIFLRIQFDKGILISWGFHHPIFRVKEEQLLHFEKESLTSTTFAFSAGRLAPYPDTTCKA